MRLRPLVLAGAFLVTGCATTAGGRRLHAVVHTMSAETDLAIVEVEGRALPAAVLRDTARLGDEVHCSRHPGMSAHRRVSLPGPPS